MKEHGIWTLYSGEQTLFRSIEMHYCFSGATSEEISAAKKLLNEMAGQAGRLKKFKDEHDDFKYFGCGTIITAQKKK